MSSAYLHAFLDTVEDLPVDMQRAMASARMLDWHTLDLQSKLATVLDALKTVEPASRLSTLQAAKELLTDIALTQQKKSALAGAVKDIVQARATELNAHLAEYSSGAYRAAEEISAQQQRPDSPQDRDAKRRRFEEEEPRAAVGGTTSPELGGRRRRVPTGKLAR